MFKFSLKVLLDAVGYIVLISILWNLLLVLEWVFTKISQ